MNLPALPMLQGAFPRSSVAVRLPERRSGLQRAAAAGILRSQQSDFHPERVMEVAHD